MNKKRISITVPTYPSVFDVAVFGKIKTSLSTLFLEGYNAAHQGFQTRRSSISFSSKISKLKNKIPKGNWNKILRIGLPVVGVALLGVVVWAAFSPRENSQAVQSATNEAPKALATQEINKTYTFPVSEGEEELTRFTYTIESAKLQKQIIVKGQRANSVEGRIFLILDLKLVNEYDRALSINTRDYVRVVLDGNEEEQLAPDIHNDPVELQAISTKPTRLGLAIDESVSSIELRVGEIDEEKETIKLDLSK